MKFTRLPAGSIVPRWSCAHPAFKWMRAIKQEFDPNNVFPASGFLGL